MASRPALDEWLSSAEELLDDPVLVGRRLGVVPQERGRDLELRYGSILGDDYLQLANVDPTPAGRATVSSSEDAPSATSADISNSSRPSSAELADERRSPGLELRDRPPVYYDEATARLSTYDAGAILVVTSVAPDEDPPDRLQIAFGVDENDVRLTCLGDTHFERA